MATGVAVVRLRSRTGAVDTGRGGQDRGHLATARQWIVMRAAAVVDGLLSASKDDSNLSVADERTSRARRGGRMRWLKGGPARP